VRQFAPVFGSQTEARRFFADKVIQRADVEGIPLSDDERRMLFWSESAPESVADKDLAERLAAQISDADYEAKIVGLLRRSFIHDVNGDARAKDIWREAWSVLEQGDHYVLVMIDQAVGRKLKPWWKFW
jgi:hypothetical protein